MDAASLAYFYPPRGSDYRGDDDKIPDSFDAVKKGW
jgi:hypothetical protein